jgi:hypothetical protein
LKFISNLKVFFVFDFCKVDQKFVCDAPCSTMPTPTKETKEDPSDPGATRKSALKKTGANASPPGKVPRVAGETGEMDVDAGGFGTGSAVAGMGPPGFPSGSLSSGGVPVDLASRLFPNGSGIETPVPEGPPNPDEEPTMKQMFAQMLKMETNLSTKIDNVQMQFETLKNEIQTVKQEMVTKTIFQSLEDRVRALEQGGVNNSQMNWMLQQVGRLDPANKSLCLKGFSEKDAAKRFKLIEQLFDSIGYNASVQNVEHIWTGPKGDRRISPNSLVELSSRAVREEALKELKEDNSIASKSEFQGIKFDPAKTSMQRKRNDSLHRVCDLLKKDPRSQGKSVSIQWQIEESKDRGVQLDGVSIFLQKSTDLSGVFLSPFQDLVV